MSDDERRAIVDDLAATDPMIGYETYDSCLFCEAWAPDDHDPTCLWVRAVIESTIRHAGPET